jgi:hypothetical protein
MKLRSYFIRTELRLIGRLRNLLNCYPEKLVNMITDSKLKHPAYCTMGTGGPFPGGKSAAGA